jgi:hypothetical protein
MESQIVCPNCKKIISNKSIIDDAVKGVGSHAQSILCECGERITYWNITALLRDQKTFGRKFQNWVRSFAASRKS